ncbi:GDSL/SGNH-like Acyl-Esterase family found in Pmr5 and Cas1p, partial [Pristimantis euphronides]
MRCFCSADIRQLLHNKFVVVLGDSIQRSVYKDLVKLLQKDEFLSETQLRDKGELSFEKDTLVEGGLLTGLHNNPNYREVRQYRTGHHLVRFYFLTRAYSSYLESILSDFQEGPQPDVLIVNSCVWDLVRYKCLETYKTNLDTLFRRLMEVLSPQCLILWTMAMPVGYRNGEFPQNLTHNLRPNIVEGNFFSATLANLYKLDVVDMHYSFRCSLHLRCRDAVHWNQVAHRKYTQILLTHITEAWGVQVPEDKMLEGSTVNAASPQPVALNKDPNLCPTTQERAHSGHDSIPLLPTPNVEVMESPYAGKRMWAGYTVMGHQNRLLVPSSVSAGATYIQGYTSFDGSSIDDMPGECTDYIDGVFCVLAASPFVTDSLLLTTNITPGYFTPPSGPVFSSYTFAWNNPFYNMWSPRNFTPFPVHIQYPQRGQKMKKRSKRTLKLRGLWSHPYRLPPI